MSSPPTLGAAALAALAAHFQAVDESTESTESTVTAVTTRATTKCDVKTHGYWEERFAAEAEYEWLGEFALVRPLLERLLPHTGARVLVVGCGNSNLSRDLYDAGWHDVVSTDFSAVVINAMILKDGDGAAGSKRPGLTWAVADMLQLQQYEDSSFDCVIDKAAMDSLLSAETSVWDPDDSTKSDADLMCRATSRVMKPGGSYFQVSFVQPHFRRRYLAKNFGVTADPDALVEAYGWTVKHHAFGGEDGGSLQSYVYQCTKHQTPS